MMFAVTRIPSSLIEDRLDARYNAPLAVETRKKILTSGIQTGTVGSLYNLVCGPFGSTLTSDEHNANGEILLIQPTNISGDSFSDTSSWRITKKALIEKDLKTYPQGTLLFARVGIYPHVGIIPKGVGLCTISSSMIAGLPKRHLDAHYFVAFFKCSLGNILLNAAQKVTAQPTIGTTEIANTLVPIPSGYTQKYIGDKVRQAEQLRAWAKRLRTSVDDHLNSLNLPINEPPALLNRVSAQTMEDRLDPRPYRTHYLCLVSEIEKLPHDSISTLVTLASGCPVSSNDFLENSGIPLVRIRNIGFDDFIGLDTGVSQDVYQDMAKYHARDKMIVVGMDGIFRSQFFISDELPMLVNQRVAMLSPQKIRGELLTHWLNRPEGQMQLNQWAVKTTVEHTSLSDIGRVLIPRLDKNLENKLADCLLNARLAYRYAKFLTQVAKTLVETLIEGQLAERQLIEAQQALEDGDNSLDQAILSKLSAEGYAIEGATPLFSDVDELYSLLEEAAQAEAEE